MQKIRALLRVVVLSLGMAAAVAAPAQGQDWAREMFKQTEHDFGTIARGAKAEYRFSFQNIWEEDVHVQSVSSSCGCTTPAVSKATLKKFETADIVATIDTRNHIGQKEATVTVRFDQPFAAEVRLKVSCNIRGDVVVQPGVIQFDAVPQGDGAARKVQVLYAGQPGWKIAAVEVANTSPLEVDAKEIKRTASEVSYDLTVTLKKNAPVGPFKEQIVLLTNDPDARTARVPVPIEGSVVASITLAPSPLWVGVLAPGGTATKHLVVRSKAPFHVLQVHCPDPRFTFNRPDAARSLQMIEVNFTAGDATGDVTQKITVETDAPGGKALEAVVQARVMKAETPGAAEKSAPVELKPLPPSDAKTTGT